MEITKCGWLALGSINCTFYKILRFSENKSDLYLDRFLQHSHLDTISRYFFPIYNVLTF